MKNLKNLYGRDPEKRHLCSDIWSEIKATERTFQKSCYEKVIDTYHISEINYWDSRGAIAPWAIAAGGHTRTGLEDNVRWDKDTLAPSNAALVARTAEICARYDRPVATPEQARALLGLRPSP